jgi:hypothetical protein
MVDEVRRLLDDEGAEDGRRQETQERQGSIPPPRHGA